MILQNLQNDFKGSNWKREIDVRDFIQSNYEAYDGDESFLVGPTERTNHLWNVLSKMFEVEREKRRLRRRDKVASEYRHLWCRIYR